MTRKQLDKWLEGTKTNQGKNFNRKDLLNFLYLGLILPVGIIMLIAIIIKRIKILNQKEDKK